MVTKKADPSGMFMVHTLWTIVFLLIAFYFSSPTEVAAADPLKKGKTKAFEKSNEVIFITSDRMELDRKKNTISYKGHVVTVRGDMMMKSDSLTATYDLEMKGVREIVAEGKVKVVVGTRMVTGNRAVFNRQKNTITLTGKPVVQQGQSRVSGSRITLFIDEDRGVVEGGRQRVKAVLFPGDLKR